MDKRFRPDLYECFRILVIGRANAGKTTLLKRVCDTTEDPCIYDKNGKLQLEPTSERGVHDINRAFSFRSNPGFIFHDSPGFEAGDESQLKKVQDFIEKRSKSTKTTDQLHAIWFCLKPDTSRPLLELEEKFFNEERAVPVIAIITKFDDLMAQIYDEDLDEEENRHDAKKEVQNKFINPLHDYSYPPKAYTLMEDLHDENSNHQNQVKDLVEKTAKSLNDIALKMLFISIQQNNLELCTKYALKYGTKEYLAIFSNNSQFITVEILIEFCFAWFPHLYRKNYVYNGYNHHNLHRLLGHVYRHLGDSNHGLVGDLRRISYDHNDYDNDDLLDHDLAGITIEFARNLSFEMNKPTLVAFASIIICTEFTFWVDDSESTLVGSLKEALKSFTSIGLKEKVEKALYKYDQFPYSDSDWKDIYSDIYPIVLEYCHVHQNKGN